MRKVLVTSISLYPDQMERLDAVVLARRSGRATVIRELVEIGLPSLELSLDTGDFSTADDVTRDASKVKVAA